MAEEGTRREEAIAALQQDYRTTFGNEAGKRVLKHLEHVCYAKRRMAHSEPVDPTMLALREGARSVWLVIEEQLTMSQAELLGRPTTAVLEEKKA